MDAAFSFFLLVAFVYFGIRLVDRVDRILSEQRRLADTVGRIEAKLAEQDAAGRESVGSRT